MAKKIIKIVKFFKTWYLKGLAGDILTNLNYVSYFSKWQIQNGTEIRESNEFSIHV